MQDGVLYVAEGPEYLKLAVASAQSARAVMPDLNIDIFTDATPPRGLFDQVHPIPQGLIRAKIECLPLSRFDRTLYLDCDTLVLQPFGDLFDILRRFALALCHDMRRASDLIRQGHLEATPYAFPQMNGGVILYRSGSQTADFFAQWAQRYAAAGFERDQVTLKDLLWASDVPFYVLPPEFNLRRVTLLDAWEPLDARPTIVHSHRLLDHLRVQGAERVHDLADILALERAALQQEWAALDRAAADHPADEDPSLRFARAQLR